MNLEVFVDLFANIDDLKGDGLSFSVTIQPQKQVGAITDVVLQILHHLQFVIGSLAEDSLLLNQLNGIYAPPLEHLFSELNVFDVSSHRGDDDCTALVHELVVVQLDDFVVLGEALQILHLSIGQSRN